jgi:hypothetical protein
MMRSLIQPFSADYDIIPDASVLTHDGEAIMDEDLYEVLKQRYGQLFVAKVEDQRHTFEPRQSIPALTVAVPEYKHDGRTPNGLLIKNDTKYKYEQKTGF